MLNDQLPSSNNNFLGEDGKIPHRNHPLLNHFIYQYNIHHCEDGSSEDDKKLFSKLQQDLTEHLNNNNNDQSIDEYFSCLSPSVSKLVHKNNDSKSLGNQVEIVLDNHHDEKLIDSTTGLLLIQDENSGFPLLDVLSDNFLNASLQLREICKAIWKSNSLDSILLADNQLSSLIVESIKITKQPLETLEYLQRLVQQDDSFSNVYSIFSLLSTMVEHLITSVVYTVATLDESKNGNDVVIPLTLTEILECEEVKKVLPIKLLNIIKVFMGPPKGLNLRNVLYHGFLDETEIHPSYLSFLWRVYFTTCKCITDYTQQSGWTEFVLKPRTDLTNVSQYEELFHYQNNQLLFQNENDSTLIDKILQDTYFIIPTRIRIIKKAFEFLKKGITQSSPIDLQLSLCLLFPQFEFCLRRVYIASNQKVDERTWSAQNEEFFSTLDVIFANHLETSIYCDSILSSKDQKTVIDHQSLTPNELFNIVGNNIGDALMDAFIFYRGPKLRDKIAHCQVLGQMDPKLVQHFFLIFISLCVHFSKDGNELIFESSPLLESIRNNFITRKVSFSFYDIRTRFINFWNEVKDVYYQQKKFYCCGEGYPSENSVGSIKELDEYKCAINRDGFSLMKSLDDNIRDDLINILETNFKKGQPKNVQFSMNECYEYLKVKYPLIGKIQSEDIECTYNNHFHCPAQQITNVEMLVRVLENLYTGLEALEEKYLDLCNLINERKARTPQRKLFVVMTQTRLIIDFIFKFFIEYTFIQFEIIDKRQAEEGDGKKRLNWVQQLLTQALRIEGQIKEGTIGVMCAKFLEFIIQKEKNITKDFQDFELTTNQ